MSERDRGREGCTSSLILTQIKSRRRSVDTILHGPPVNQHRPKPGMRRRGSFFGTPNLRASGIFPPDDADAERLARRLVLVP
jgi:hypothetical protein